MVTTVVTAVVGTNELLVGMQVEAVAFDVQTTARNAAKPAIGVMVALLVVEL